MCRSDHPFYVSNGELSGANFRPEAEFLADRIGIMVNGSLSCTGVATSLKMDYGGGYKLTITCSANETTRGTIERYGSFQIS